MRVGAPGVPDWIRFLSEHCTHSERIGLCASLFTYGQSVCPMQLFPC